MSSTPPAGNPTTDALLAAIREHTGVGGLRWAAEPQRLTGGFRAEMYVVELAGAPVDLAGRLVARVMPHAGTAAFETGMQRHVGRCGLAVPAIRAAGGPGALLDRAWSLMDLAPGRPLLTGLSATSATLHSAQLLRDLPRLLAEVAAAVHRCPIDGLDAALTESGLDEAIRTGDGRGPLLTDLLGRFRELASSIGRADLAAVADSLVATAPPGHTICHGDLHPFNVLVDGSRDRWTLIDWSTAVVADRHYDLGFTTLMLANPPLGGPAPVRAIARAAGRRIAASFLRAYERSSGQTVDEARLAWGRRAHAFRAVLEVAGWEASGTLAEHATHPWLSMRPALERELRAPEPPTT